MRAKFYGGSLDGQIREQKGFAKTIIVAVPCEMTIETASHGGMRYMREEYARNRLCSRRDEQDVIVELGYELQQIEGPFVVEPMPDYGDDEEDEQP